MKRWIWLALCISLVAIQAEADSLDLSFNDSSAQVGYRHPLVEDALGRSVVHARLLYNADEKTRLGSAGFDFIGEPGNVPGLELGIGAQLYGGRTHRGQDLLALGIGGRTEYYPPALGGFGVTGKIIYAPKIFTLIDAERLLETGLGVAYSVTPRVRVMLEYQNIRTKFDDYGNWTIDDGLRIGFQARF